MDTTEEKLEHEFSESSHTSEVNLLLSDEGGESLQQKKFSRAPTRIHLFILYFTNFTTITILSVFLFKRNGALQTLDPSLEGVYFPAKDAIEYEVHRFESAFYNRTAYMGPPTPELDALWLNLSAYGLSKISDSQAAQLSESTMANLDNPHEHLLTLDVFHQIHCLFSIRKFFYPDYYQVEREYYANGTERTDTLSWMHWDHCIDSIRQSLMCSGDITPVVYHIDPRGTGLFPKLQGTHICRNYDKITEWAREHDGSNARFQFREGDALLDLYRLDPQGYMQKGGSE